MVNFKVKPEKQAQLHQRMQALGLTEKDLKEQFIKGWGKGGQKINKTNNCVMLKHLPTGTIVRCQRERSLSINRFLARRLLCDLLEGGNPKKVNTIAKRKKQKARRKRRSPSSQEKPE